MKIKKITSQNRRDFRAIYECEHCGNEEIGSGYDDDYYHTTVIPAMTCTACSKNAPKSYQPRTTKYPAGFQL